MEMEKREKIEQLLADMQEWYTSHMRQIGAVVPIEFNGVTHELVTYSYIEAFNLCNYMLASEFIAIECDACNCLRQFFQALEAKLLRGLFPHVEYYNVLKITVIRSAIEALH